MAPNVESLSSYMKNTSNKVQKPPRLSMESLQRTISDISFQLSKEESLSEVAKLPPISEVIEDSKCECCGMSEECTPDYVKRVREKFTGKFVCGLCSEAVKEEMEKNGGNKGKAVEDHMSACVKFNRFGRAYPVLNQAEAMRELFKKSSVRAKSISPRDFKAAGVVKKGGGLARSSSCIPAITREDR